jgi:hypothetical protein
LARKEEEIQNPQNRSELIENKAQTIIDKLEKKKFLKIESNNRITYL